MRLNRNVKAQINSISKILEKGKMDRQQFINLLEKSQGKNLDTTSILIKAQTTAEKDYQSMLENRAINKNSKDGIHIREEDAWILEDLIEEDAKKLNNEKEFMQEFLAPQLKKTMREHEKNLKAITRAKVKEKRAKAVGLAMDGLKERFGLSR